MPFSPRHGLPRGSSTPLARPVTRRTKTARPCAFVEPGRPPFASGNAQTGHVASSSRSDRALHQQSGRARRPHDEVVRENRGFRRSKAPLIFASSARSSRPPRSRAGAIIDALTGYIEHPWRNPPVLYQVANLGSYDILQIFILRRAPPAEYQRPIGEPNDSYSRVGSQLPVSR